MSDQSDKPFPTEYAFNGCVYKPHPAADCFPLLTGTRYQDLVDDVRHNGLVMPVIVLGDYVLDGRNRLLAADEVGLSKVLVRELPEDTDAVAFVASLNIHRRHLTATQRSASAARLLKLSHAAFRDNHPDEPDPDKLVSPIANDPVLAASVPAETDSSESGAVESSPRARRPSPVPVASPRPSANGDVGDDGDDGDGDVEPAVPLPGQQVDLTEDNSPVLSARKIAEGFDVSRQSVTNAAHVIDTAPDLERPMSDGTVSLHDALRIQYEPEPVRKQAVEDVREGRASTAARAIRQRYEREPVSDPDSRTDRPSGQTLPVQSPPPGEVTVPTSVLDHVRQLIGDITFDPCSAAWCVDHVGAADWCGADADGLVAEWSGSVWVFPPPELADPFISKTLLELESGRVAAAALLIPMTPWSDATRLAFGSPYFHAVVVPSSPLTCRRPDGSSVCPADPHWIVLLGRVQAPAVDVFGTFAATVLVPQGRSSSDADAVDVD